MHDFDLFILAVRVLATSYSLVICCLDNSTDYRMLPLYITVSSCSPLQLRTRKILPLIFFNTLVEQVVDRRFIARRPDRVSTTNYVQFNTGSCACYVK